MMRLAPGREAMTSASNCKRDGQGGMEVQIPDRGEGKQSALTCLYSLVAMTTRNPQLPQPPQSQKCGQLL